MIACESKQRTHTPKCQDATARHFSILYINRRFLKDAKSGN